MAILIGVFHTLLVVLAVSGTHKLLRPTPASAALRSASLVPGQKSNLNRNSRRMARAVGLTEIAVAVQGLAVPQMAPETDVGAALNAASADVVALTFGIFILFVAHLRVVDPDAGCGCFGAATAPPGRTHQQFNIAAFVVSAATGSVAAFTSQSQSLSLVTDGGLTVILPYAAALIVAAAVFLHGPALMADLRAATTGDHHAGQRRAATFSINPSWQPVSMQP